MAKRRQRGKGSGSVYKRKGHAPYYLAYRDHENNRRIECSHTTDKATAERILAKLLADVALRKRGIIDPQQEVIAGQSKRTIEDHLKEYKASIEAKQRGTDHVRRTMNFIREVFKACGFALISDIAADPVNQYVADMLDEGWAARTVQGRVVAVKGFTKWLADHAKLRADPLRSVKRPSVKADRRHVRRMLLPDEWPYLHAAVLTDGDRNGMEPHERATLYMLAIQTGLRASEIESLTKADLRLAAIKPYVRCKAANTKNKKEAMQYIDAQLAEWLRTVVASKMPGAPVFSIQAGCDLAEALRADLAEARKSWLAEVKHNARLHVERAESDFLLPTNHAGEALDFHSLRHSCGAWLAIRGVHPKTIQTVMRHSSITLTMDTYGHLLPNQHSDAIAEMSAMFGGGEAKNERKAGG